MLTNPSASQFSFFLLFSNLGNNTKNARKGLAISKLPVAFMHVLTHPLSLSHHQLADQGKLDFVGRLGSSYRFWWETEGFYSNFRGGPKLNRATA